MINLPNIMIVGLTGISGAGKSTVCGILRKGGFEIIDCDGIAREIADNRRFLSELQTRFNADVLNADGTLNRAETARLIFNDKGKLHLYNSIIFPYIIYDIIGRIRSSAKDTVLDAPTLFDCGIDMICNKIIGVISNREICRRKSPRTLVNTEKRGFFQDELRLYNRKQRRTFGACFNHRKHRKQTERLDIE